MPTRTVLPTISITWTTTSSPTMTFSPARRGMISMAVPPWIRVAGGCAGVLRGLHGHVGEQRGAHGMRDLVDHLVAAAVGHDDGRMQVRAEVRQLGSGADDDPDLGGVGAHAGRVGVGELDREVGEERPRI